MQKYFTTPIYYINGSPHIGHAYTTILGDVLKKFEQMRGADVFYTTGTDEHGQKNQTSCQESGLPLPEFLKMRSDNFRNLFDKMDIDYDHFVRRNRSAELYLQQGAYPQKVVRRPVLRRLRTVQKAL